MSTPGENALSAYLVAEREKFYRLAYSCLHHREDALDAVQTAVCRALERRASRSSPWNSAPRREGPRLAAGALSVLRRAAYRPTRTITLLGRTVMLLPTPRRGGWTSS